jgi:general secretion pathway protein L
MQIDSLLKMPLGRGPTSGAGTLLSSWRTGLLDCLPPILRQRLERRDSRLLLTLADGVQGRLELAGGADETLALESGDDAALRDAVQRAQRADAAVVLSAAPGDVLVRRFNMPAQTRDNLPKVLAYELDRLTPFHSEAVFFDHRILSPVGENQIAVELALVRRDRVEPWIAALGRIGTLADALVWPDAWPGANLLPKERRKKPRRAARILSALLWLSMLALLVAVALTPLVQKNRITASLEQEVAAARVAASEAGRLSARLEQTREAARFILDRKRQALYTSEMLRRLTELLPDHTWVSQLNCNGNTVDFRGESKQATGLIELLSGDPAFSNIGFKSPVVGIRNTDRERFHIQFDFQSAEGAG